MRSITQCLHTKYDTLVCSPTLSRLQQVNKNAHYILVVHMILDVIGSWLQIKWFGQLCCCCQVATLITYVNIGLALSYVNRTTMLSDAKHQSNMLYIYMSATDATNKMHEAVDVLISDTSVQSAWIKIGKERTLLHPFLSN